MPTSLPNASLRLSRVIGMAFVGSLTLVGCDKQEAVSTYTVSTHESIQTPEFLEKLRQPERGPQSEPVLREERMLAVVAETGPAMWFFKLQGAPEAVAAREAEFRELLKSVRFPVPERAEWKLPADWQEKPGSGMRYATLVLPGKPPLEVSITTFPVRGENPAERLLENINRWRNQLKLPPVTSEELPTQSESIPMGDVKATYVNLLGHANSAAAMPGARGAGPAAPPAAPPRSAPETAPEKIDYTKPDEWTAAELAPMSLATFEVKEGDRKVTISVSRAGGSLLANLNRWRGQVGLEPVSEEEAVKSLTRFTVGERFGGLADLKGQDPRSGQDKAILGLMIPDGEVTVFVKLTGDPQLAIQERARFEAFAKSLRF